MKKKLTAKQIDRIIAKVSELGKLQTVERRITRSGGSVWETTAEHSWQLAMMAWLLMPYYEQELDAARVLKLALIHDVVEIYAGDTYAFDHIHRQSKHQREDEALLKLFGDGVVTEKEMAEAWKEYALRKSPEAYYVAGIDKLVPMVRHLEGNKDPHWKNTVTEQEMRRYKEPQLQHSTLFTALFERMVLQIRHRGYFAEEAKEQQA